jgi:arylsulfatase A-like enzyme
LLKLAGASVNQKLPLDGRDIWPVLTQGKPSPHDEILLNTSPRAGAIRVGDWKLVINGATGTSEEDDESPAPARRKKAARQNQPQKVELFNLAQDLSEKHDLSAEKPEKARELRARYDALAKQAAKPANAPKPPGYTPPKVWGEKE